MAATLFSTDPGIVTIGSVCVSTGSITATLGANSTLFSLRWSSSTLLFVPDFIAVGLIVDAAITTSVVGTLDLFIARSFTVADTGGTALTLTGDNNQFKSDFGASVVADARVAGTAGLTPGTRTLDSQAFNKIPFVTGTAVGNPLTMTQIYKRTDLFPIVLAQNEGLVIRNGVAGPATGTFVVHVYMRWLEVNPTLNV